MKITITTGDQYLLTEHIDLNDEGIRMRDEAYAAKKAAEQAAAQAAEAQATAPPPAVAAVSPSNDPADDRSAFQATLDHAIDRLAGVASPQSAPAAATPGTLDAYFEEAATIYGVDKQLLLAVARTESNFTPDATSPSGAMGVMQLMPATAEYLGVDDAYDAHDNILGGAKLLRELLDQYNGSVSLALAAYNAGSGTVAKYGNTVPPSIQGYVDKVMGYYHEGVQVPAQAQKEATDEEVAPTDRDDAYRLLMADAKSVIDRLIVHLEGESS